MRFKRNFSYALRHHFGNLKKSVPFVAVLLVFLGGLAWIAIRYATLPHEVLETGPATIISIVRHPDPGEAGAAPVPWVIRIRLDSGTEGSMHFLPVPTVGSRICVEKRNGPDLGPYYAFLGYMVNLESDGVTCGPDIT